MPTLIFATISPQDAANAAAREIEQQSFELGDRAAIAIVMEHIAPEPIRTRRTEMAESIFILRVLRDRLPWWRLIRWIKYSLMERNAVEIGRDT